ncbi:MAG: type II secretion system minor pseudopilin GspK [Nitrospirota bacterium]|nr:type II secretion system minor pseudopilin GspK [Nitrospirota bacterium]
MRGFIHKHVIPGWMRDARRLLGEERGVALVLTLLVVALMTTLIVEFDFRTRLDLRSAYNFRDNAQATVLADTGARVVSYILSLDKDNYDGSPRTEDRFKDATLWWELSGVNGREIGGFPIAGEVLPPGMNLILRVTDEGGKLNLNDLSYDSSAGTVPAEVTDHIEIFTRLLEELGFDDDPDLDVGVAGLVECLLDRLDSSVGNSGVAAQCRHDGDLADIFAAGKGPMRTVDELRLVYGYTPEVVKRLTPHVTVLPPDVAPGGTPPAGGGTTVRPMHKINLNTASIELLAALHPELGRGGAGNIDEFRSEQPFRSLPGDLQQVHGIGSGLNVGAGTLASKLAPLVAATSDYFAVQVEGDVGDTRRTVRALLSRKRGTAALKSKKLEVLWWRVE